DRQYQPRKNSLYNPREPAILQQSPSNGARWQPMTARPVHWHEGMFLRPHHFQAAQRHASGDLHRSARWDLHHCWGLRSIDLDLDALANHRFVVRALQARLRDGTLVSVPEDGTLEALDLKPALGQGTSVTVSLAVPALHLGRANVASGAGDEARYLVDV